MVLLSRDATETFGDLISVLVLNRHRFRVDGLFF